MQDEQRRAFIDLYGGDLIVVPGDQVNKTLMDFYRHNYELAGSKSGPWTEPDLPPLPEEWTDAGSVALIYDAEDGLGFYVDYAVAQQAFAAPDLVRRRIYREVVSAYLREEGISPVPIRRLVAEAGPDAAGPRVPETTEEAALLLGTRRRGPAPQVQGRLVRQPAAAPGDADVARPHPAVPGREPPVSRRAFRS
ncbi:hypothetical protein LUX33_00580 [Actinomadura madurae]|uniref:hypothetical protein n=1 Tax=Actinomadura madurae TaxID=1993 RepID=UPI0020D2222C|nr:hypothetical protein [Actinomadura madurae]MCP9947103.1 hypothetical protein [Actinomadura madurae]